MLVEVKSQVSGGTLLGKVDEGWMGQVNAYAQRQLQKAPWLVSRYLFAADMTFVRVCLVRRSEGPDAFVAKMSRPFYLGKNETMIKLLYVLHESYKSEVLNLESIRPCLTRW